MENKHRKFAIGMLTVVLLSACGNTSDKASSTLDNKSQPAQITNEDSGEHAVNEDNAASNTNDTNDKEVVASLKAEYLMKLIDTQKETDELRENLEDDSTYGMKDAEGKRYEVWDGLLNEIYGVLKHQLSSEEMEQLRIKQREWIKYRDKTATEASLKYEGGTMEQLEYVAVLSTLTEERCFELVEDYMK